MRYNFDGGGGGDGGPAGWGWVRSDGASGCGALPPGSTSNEAEYTALTRAVYDAVSIARDFGQREFVFQGDSKLVVEQVNGNWKVHANRLRPYVRNVQMLLDGLEEWSLLWIPRQKNRKADEMAWRGKTLWSVQYAASLAASPDPFPRGWEHHEVTVGS